MQQSCTSSFARSCVGSAKTAAAFSLHLLRHQQSSPTIRQQRLICCEKYRPSVDVNKPDNSIPEDEQRGMVCNSAFLKVTQHATKQCNESLLRAAMLRLKLSFIALNREVPANPLDPQIADNCNIGFDAAP